MVIPLTLLAFAALTAAVAPRLLARAAWADREPVLALWVWQCVVAAVLLCCGLAMSLSAAVAWAQVHSGVFAPAPAAVREAYSGTTGAPWAAALAVALAAGGLWTAVMFVREVRTARAQRRRRREELRRRAPLLPGEDAGAERLVVLEGERPDAWWLPGGQAQLVITTAALRRLKRRQLDAVLAHEQGHSRARHHWLQHCAGALAGVPRMPVFRAFRDEVHRLCELAADDAASRRFGRMTFATALVELNEERGVFGPGPGHHAHHAHLPQRVDRLLAAAPRFTPARRLRLTVAALLAPAVPLLVAFGPGLSALA